MHIAAEDIYEKLVMLGEQWSDDNAAAELLEESKKTLISQLSVECEEKAANAKEAYALRHPDYIKHVKDMVHTRKQANKSRVKYDSYRIYTDMKRTEAATERAANRSAT